MKSSNDALKNLPGVDKLLLKKPILQAIKIAGTEPVKYLIRETLSKIRNDFSKTSVIPDEDELMEMLNSGIEDFMSNKLVPLLNATGVIVHTNLGRAPFSRKIIEDVSKVLYGYNNLEYDIEKGERGSRHNHLEARLKYLTGAEDVLVVNNNAAAVMLILRSFSKDKEVIVSRGELIEIGGSFRIPEIMAASDCKMVEVGATNKTHLRDYEKAISVNTALLFKAHKSNYTIEGFTSEVSLQELVALGKKHGIPVVYDMGSGLLQHSSLKILEAEPDVKQTLAYGIDLVSFSGDKLIGGPQAGIIAGKKKFIAQLKKEPLVRALRVGKTTIAYMEAALSYYLDEKSLFANNSIFLMLSQSPEQIHKRAFSLQQLLLQHKIESELVNSTGFCGGGAMPGESLSSTSVKLTGKFTSGKVRAHFYERMFYALLKQKPAVVSVLKKGELYFDLLTIPDDQLEQLAQLIKEAHSGKS